MPFAGFFGKIRARLRPKEEPVRIDHRAKEQEAALILIHGFSGNTRATWASLVDLLVQEQKISSWDIYGLGFPSSLRIDVPGIWTADPDLTVLAQELRTSLSLPPLNRYRAIAIAAHSMGGLIIQRALLDDASISKRIAHLFLIGTPSDGLVKARVFRRFKRQFRDMAKNSPFIQSLRSSWNAKYSGGTSFSLKVIAGDRDQFVPPSSSLSPFPDGVRAVVPGNHIEIVRALNTQNQTFLFLVDSLSGTQKARQIIDGARLAVELRDFQSAIDTLLPRAPQLDDNALVSLALALEGTGRGAEALQLLENRYQGGTSSTDALGVLAGRLKRRWLVDRVLADFTRARELYALGLASAESASDHDQAYYHAINIAFLDLMMLAPTSSLTPQIRSLAESAFRHCQDATPNNWRFATEGEAQLILGNLDEGVNRYAAAIVATNSPRQIDSMYGQAIQVADRMFGRAGLEKIEAVFRIPNY
jgi:pimeloyl-ACP methyl ester carboxylesterase